VHSPPAERPTVISRLNLVAFTSPAFRRYFLASTLASASLWMYGPAMDWIVLTQTGRTGAVGIVQTALLVALTISTLPAGALCDRFGPKRINAVALGGLAATVAGVEVLAATRTLTFETAAGASFLIGIFDGLWGVSAWILLPMSVSPRLLGSAIGLTYLTGGIGRLVGAPLGGAVLQVAGSVAFIPTAVGLLAATAATLSMTGLAESAQRRPELAAVGGPRIGFSAALYWIRAQPAALAVAVLALLAAGSITTYPALLPALTRDVLHGDSATLGTLSGIGGVGVILGSLALDSVGRRMRRGRLVVGGYLLSGVLIGLLGVTRVVPWRCSSSLASRSSRSRSAARSSC
jgi:MFS family permease